jgi:hypothetical protein
MLYINTLMPSGKNMYHVFNIRLLWILPTKRIYDFCIILNANSDYFSKQR